MTKTRPVRSILAALALSLSLAGCSALDYDLAQDKRSIQPIPARLVASMNAKGMSETSPILIRLFKQESELELWKQDKNGLYALLKTYPICRWSGRLGPKTRDGDRQAPEGFYQVAAHQMNPHSQYYLSFNLGYPNRLEAALGYSGGSLMIHGACSSRGCYAITDEAAAEIYSVAREAFRGGQASFQVQAYPFRMTPENMAIHRNDPNMAFWQTLKDGNDHFEVTRMEPRVGACERRYVFNVEAAMDLDPLGPCPPAMVDPAIANAIENKKAQDNQRVAEVLAGERDLPAMSYIDGGMHPSFRAILARSGPEALARRTSERAPISRPDAALADPYEPLVNSPRG